MQTELSATGRGLQRLVLLSILAAVIGAVTATAQSTTGTIQGTVRDNQDAVVPGATVTVRNVETNATRT